MDRKDICKLWIEYLKESNFRKEKGEAAFLAYIERIEEKSDTRQLTPFPSVRKISDIIEVLIDKAHSETIIDGDPSFEHFKKKLIRNIKEQEKTSLLLHIHCPGIPPRGGKENVLKEVRNLLTEKLAEIRYIREFYLTWTEPGKRIDPEVELYLELYRGRKKGKKNKELQAVALRFAGKLDSNRLSKEEDGYLDESQISRAIRYAKRILRNVENGHFPGDYKSLP
jgi:hypothetical protein